jgi:hypothetical protein
MSTNAALQNVLDEAEAAAASNPPVTNNNVVPIQTQNNALAPLGQPDLQSFVNSGGMTVDQFLNVKPASIRLGDMKTGTIEKIEAIIDMIDITPLYVCRIEVGGNTSYIRSYNGVTTSRGENFQQAIALKERQPGAKSSGIYPTVEVPFELAADVLDNKGNKVGDEGATVGFTPSLTGFTEFQRFCKQLGKKDPRLLQSRLRVNLLAKTRTNKNGNEWLVIDYEFVGEA